MKTAVRQLGLIPLETWEREACDYLCIHEPPEGYFFGNSGGKDSAVTRKLCLMAGVKHASYYSHTGIDAPETVQFIRENYPEVQWLYPKKSFWNAIQTEHPPLGNQRWCCDVLKKDPGKYIPLPWRIMGLRAEESNARASRPRTDWNEKRKIWTVKPIFAWKEWQVWEFIEKYRLAYPVLYDEGWSRIGCVICPFICRTNQAELNRNRARWPGFYRAFEHACRRWFEKRLAKGEPQVHATFEAYMTAYYKGFDDEKKVARTNETDTRLLKAMEAA